LPSSLLGLHLWQIARQRQSEISDFDDEPLAVAVSERFKLLAEALDPLDEFRLVPGNLLSGRRVLRDQGSIYVRDYAGAGPAFALMHGFPDNLHIYDYLIPHLVARGRRVVAFDFLGFGESDKPAGATYSFGQQLGD
jgi:hypothetical protein